MEEELLTIPIKSNTTGGSSGEGTASHSNQEYTTGGTSGGGTANHSRESEFTLSFSVVRVAQILIILYCLWTIAFLSFFLSTQFLVGFVLLKF